MWWLPLLLLSGDWPIKCSKRFIFSIQQLKITQLCQRKPKRLDGKSTSKVRLQLYPLAPGVFKPELSFSPSSISTGRCTTHPKLTKKANTPYTHIYIQNQTKKHTQPIKPHDWAERNMFSSKKYLGRWDHAFGVQYWCSKLSFLSGSELMGTWDHRNESSSLQILGKN